jgi:hypothetical protein
MLVTTKPTHTKLGYIPELKYILLRDNDTGKLELWTCSRGLSVQALILDGIELEFVREAKTAYRVPDNEFNRIHALDDIGRIYIDHAPSRASTQELK